MRWDLVPQRKAKGPPSTHSDTGHSQVSHTKESPHFLNHQRPPRCPPAVPTKHRSLTATAPTVFNWTLTFFSAFFCRVRSGVSPSTGGVIKEVVAGTCFSIFLDFPKFIHLHLYFPRNDITNVLASPPLLTNWPLLVPLLGPRPQRTYYNSGVRF